MNTWLIEFTACLLGRLLKRHILLNAKMGKLENSLSDTKGLLEHGLILIARVDIPTNVLSKYAKHGVLSIPLSSNSGRSCKVKQYDPLGQARKLGIGRSGLK